VLSKHFWNTLIVWFILLTENWDKQMLKWMLCIVVAFVKDVYSISCSQFEIWIIRLFTMLIVMFFTTVNCKSAKKFTPWQIRQSSASFANNIDKKSYVKIQNLINCQIQHTLDFRSYLSKIGGYVIRHRDFDDKHPALLKKDGVHLSFIANDIFLNQIQGALV
jgi:hypothetical protein